ncbi:MAG: hypothetical protein ACYDD0_09620 [Candidatus Dormibacteria bacterium]
MSEYDPVMGRFAAGLMSRVGHLMTRAQRDLGRFLRARARAQEQASAEAAEQRSDHQRWCDEQDKIRQQEIDEQAPRADRWLAAEHERKLAEATSKAEREGEMRRYEQEKAGPAWLRLDRARGRMGEVDRWFILENPSLEEHLEHEQKRLASEKARLAAAVAHEVDVMVSLGADRAQARECVVAGAGYPKGELALSRKEAARARDNVAQLTQLINARDAGPSTDLGRKAISALEVDPYVVDEIVMPDILGLDAVEQQWVKEYETEAAAAAAKWKLDAQVAQQEAAQRVADKAAHDEQAMQAKRRGAQQRNLEHGLGPQL